MSRNVVNHIKKNQGLKWTLKTKNQLNEEL